MDPTGIRAVIRSKRLESRTLSVVPGEKYGDGTGKPEACFVSIVKTCSASEFPDYSERFPFRSLISEASSVKKPARPHSRSKSSSEKNAYGQPAEESVRLGDFSCGRMLAWYALQTFDQTGKFVSDTMNDVDSEHSLSGSERGLAVDLASGVLRRRRTLDTVLEALLTRPRTNVESDLWTLLQMGVWQLLFARTPDHAAVDTTVNLTRKVGRERWSGFANGVLRNVTRLVTEEEQESPGTNAVPLVDGKYRLLNQDVFPDPFTERAAYAAAAFSMPPALAKRWTQRLPEATLWKACFYGLRIPSIILRVNRLKATVQQVLAAFNEAGVQVEPGLDDWSLKLASAANLRKLPGYEEGWWSVQDEAAMHAVQMLNPVEGEEILDLCAAPGGKTVQLAEISHDKASITACDISEGRLNRVHDSIDRLQLNSITVLKISTDGSDLPEGPFDAVLVDVPCSNTGVLARRPEARWRFKEGDVLELVQLQARLLMTAFDVVKPGGRIVYSTCSIEPEETIELIEGLQEHVPAFQVKEQKMLLPGQPADGAYCALIVRAPEATETDPQNTSL